MRHGRMGDIRAGFFQLVYRKSLLIHCYRHAVNAVFLEDFFKLPVSRVLKCVRFIKPKQ